MFGGLAGDTHAAGNLCGGIVSRTFIAAIGIGTAIPANRCCKVAIAHDAIVYGHRNRFERCLGNLKHAPRLAAREDRRTIHFAGFAHIGTAVIRHGQSGERVGNLMPKPLSWARRSYV